MTYYNEQLRQLQDQCSRQKHLKALLKELESQRDILNKRARELRGAMLSEQADVDKLEGRSLASFFYNVIGRMDERLTKEREEAYAAKVKYDVADRELAGVEDDIRRYHAEVSSLQGCEERYAALLKEKANAIKASGGETAEEILALEERCAFLSAQSKELQEAVVAGQGALRTAEQILASLDSAETWGTIDLFGGGLISGLSKHQHLDDAQRSIEMLQSQLRRFKTELADVTIRADIQINVEGFLRFADYFFDGLFADWAVMDRIGQSKDQVEATRSKIRSTLAQLDDMQKRTNQELDQTRSRVDLLVLKG